MSGAGRWLGPLTHGGYAGDGAEPLAGLPLQHLLPRLVVAVVGQRDGQRGRVVLLRPVDSQIKLKILYFISEALIT